MLIIQIKNKNKNKPHPDVRQTAAVLRETTFRQLLLGGELYTFFVNSCCVLAYKPNNYFDV